MDSKILVKNIYTLTKSVKRVFTETFHKPENVKLNN